MPRYFHLERFPEKWVAIDMATDDVVLTADTPQQLEADIRARSLRNVMVIRAPNQDELLFVGPG